MVDKSIDSKDLPAISAAIREIGEIEAEAVRAASGDTFSASIAGQRYSDQMDTCERAILRRLLLSALFRRIDLQVQRCASVGVSITGYDDISAWIDTKLELLPCHQESES